jgi:phenylacetic acid degradation operon negative regulatory protein
VIGVGELSPPDRAGRPGSGGDRLPELGLRPLTARSVALSALLGSHPPRLPVRARLRLADLFAMPEGSMRSALSRMVASGDLTSDDGVYRLGTRLLRRQQEQDSRWRGPVEPWDGTWWVAIVDGEARPVAARRAFRATMGEHRMAELRPNLWLRPANVPAPDSSADALLVRGGIEDRDPVRLAAQLWDLGQLAADATRLIELVDAAAGWLEEEHPSALVDSFLLSVAVVRYLRREPQLPPELTGSPWAPDELRSRYVDHEQAHRRAMGRFLAAERRD